MFAATSQRAIIASLLLTVFIWGANNTGVKVLVTAWPPGWVAATRFVCAGLIMLGMLRFTRWLGQASPVPPVLRRRLWFGGGLSLAAYILVFNLALRYTSASHVTLYLAASPVWALLWERGATQGSFNGRLQGWVATAFTVAGVGVLLWPAIESAHSGAVGELLGFACSILWTQYGRQCKALGAQLSGPEIAAHTMLRAGLWLVPLAALEAASKPLAWRLDLVLVQAYCILGGSVIGFTLWNNALRRWHTSQVYLFANLVPITTMLWGRLLLGEPVTPTFWLALVLVLTGVSISQGAWTKLFGIRWPAPE
ncbi:MAG: DMT family transporter [Verrucomicrobiae bacterium]|nr:DMT family transporter [Verrucomicrobiae bacterium]MCX7723438.1 DMT family transporter [Verrucomicrobiae bacterium]MDW7979959.1 DMT family transporter [Verrucomicrobiales bacterium]